MSTFAEASLYTGDIIAWLVVGLGAGCLAGLVMKGRGSSISVDTILGIAGAVIGGFLFGLLDTGEVGVWGSMLVAFLGACILIAMARIAARAQLQAVPKWHEVGVFGPPEQSRPPSSHYPS